MTKTKSSPLNTSPFQIVNPSTKTALSIILCNQNRKRKRKKNHFSILCVKMWKYLIQSVICLFLSTFDAFFVFVFSEKFWFCCFLEKPDFFVDNLWKICCYFWKNLWRKNERKIYRRRILLVFIIVVVLWLWLVGFSIFFFGELTKKEIISSQFL